MTPRLGTPLPMAALCLLLWACGGTSVPPADPDTIARWNGGTLSAGQFQEALIRLPASRRPSIEDGSITIAWKTEFVRELAVDRLLADRAANLDPRSHPDLKPKLDEEERNLVWDEMVARARKAIQPPTPEDVEQAYDRWLREEARPETRLVRNIFLQRRPGETRDDTLRRAEELASRVEAGEAFADLARSHSDSETRHSGGKMGAVTAETLPPPVREVVFALPEHVVSEPLVNRDGAHLFQVDSIVPASTGEFSQVEPLVRAWLQEETETDAVQQWVESLTDPAEEIVFASRAELETMLEKRALEAVVLRHGAYELRLSDLLAKETVPTADQLARRLEQLGWRERVHAYALSHGWLELPHLRLARQRVTDTQVGEFLRLEAVKEWLQEDPSRVERYFESQKARFSSPLAVQVQRWSLPLRGQPSKRLMLELESRHRAAGPSGLDLDEIERAYGGRVEDVGWQPLERLKGRVPVGVISALDPGESSPPYRYADTIEISRIVDRREPELQPLAVVHDEVVHSFLTEQGRQLYLEWRQALLDRSAFELSTEELLRLSATEIDLPSQ